MELDNAASPEEMQYLPVSTVETGMYKTRFLRLITCRLPIQGSRAELKDGS